MKTYNRAIYHCLSCGAIKRLEPDENEPICCGAQMTKAAIETVSTAEAADFQEEWDPRTQETAEVATTRSIYRR